jgi:hypothetical protein
VIHSSPKIMSFSIDPHEHLVQVPLPIGINTELVDTLFADFGGEYRTKSVPPEADRFMADVDATFVQQVFNISKRKWKPDIHHHGQPNDLGTGFEIAKWREFCHSAKLRDSAARLNLVCSDRAPILVLCCLIKNLIPRERSPPGNVCVLPNGKVRRPCSLWRCTS